MKLQLDNIGGNIIEHDRLNARRYYEDNPDAVKQYIELAWDYDEEADAWVKSETQEEVADKLGVSQYSVARVLDNIGGNIIQHDRLKARRYYEDNPDASYREVARDLVLRSDGGSPLECWLRGRPAVAAGREPELRSNRGRSVL